MAAPGPGPEWERTVESLGPPSNQHPVWVTLTILQLLTNPLERTADLLHATTPESWPAWGDFTGCEDLQDAFGVGSNPRHPFGPDWTPALDIASVMLIPLRTVDYSNGPVWVEGLIEGALAVTLIHRPDLLGGWRVHQIGPESLTPEAVDHARAPVNRQYPETP